MNIENQGKNVLYERNRRLLLLLFQFWGAKVRLFYK